MAAMEAKVDECLEFENMIEEMAEEIMQKDDIIDEMNARIIDLEENIGIQEELNENQEQYIKELNEDIANKDAEISIIQLEKEQIEELVIDENQQNSRYKLKLAEINQKCIMLQDELTSAYVAGDQKVKVSNLIDKQNALTQKLREAGKKESHMMIGKIHFWQEKLKMRVLEGFIPARLNEQTHLESLEKVQLLNITKQKALLLIREVCERQLQNVSALHEDTDQQAFLVRLLINIADQATKFIDACSRIIYALSKMNVEKYIEVTTKFMAWSKFGLINAFIEQILDLLKEGALIPKFDISQFIL